VGALDGRWALVTGASRGIGLATAVALGREGARVALLGRDGDALAKAHEAVRATGADAVDVSIDLRKGPEVGAVVAELVDRMRGAPDILVNNAGRFDLAPVHETSVEAFAASVETNLVAPFALVRAVLPAMRERGSGHVVTVGSIADRAVFPENAAYASAKHGLRALHEVLRAELRGTGVRASLVSPGPVDTALWDPHDPDARAGFTPRAQMLRADAVAEAIRWIVVQPASVNVDELRLSHA
jgi:NADP-dependent 3-hydroxy acid dehydrogenase YdfG